MGFTNTDQTTFQNMLANDPQIQAIAAKVWGNTPLNQRPSDTPKNLEKANDQASKQIMQVLANRGVKLPDKSFINPRTMSLEGEHGWAGLPTAAKVAIIAGVAATGIGAAGAMGAFGGSAAAGSGISGASSAAAAAPTAASTGLLTSTPLLSAAPMVGSAAATGGSLAAGGAGMGVASGIGTAAKTAGLVSKLLGGGSTLDKISSISKIAGPLATGIASGAQKGREAGNTAAEQAANFKLKESGQNETGLENRADLELKQTQDKRTQQSDSYQKALRSALAMNMKDASISLPPGYSVSHISGGLRPSAIGQEGRDAAGVLNKQAMQSLMDGESFTPLPALERTQPAEYQKPGALENISGAIGMGANAVNGANADSTQQTYQQKILAAIDALSKKNVAAPGTQPPPNVSVSTNSGYNDAIE